MNKQRKKRRTTELTLELDRSSLAELMKDESTREASLLVIGGMDVGCTIPLAHSGKTVLGRDPTCEGIIRDDGISRRHAEVICEGAERFLIRDLGSTNGIFVDGKRVSSRALRDGDKILLGRRTILKFVLQDPIDARFQQQLYESAVRDPLTGAYNRKHFDERISSEISFARRHRMHLSLIMFDLDHFKKVNDTYGHQAGDQVLMAVAKAVSDTLREEDVFARYGGEEFVVLARGIDPVGALALGERLRCVVEELRLVTSSQERIPVTISAGAATMPKESTLGAKEILKVADENLYKAKGEGRNRVVASAVELG